MTFRFAGVAGSRPARVRTSATRTAALIVVAVNPIIIVRAITLFRHLVLLLMSKVNPPCERLNET
jgi:hypothetical protein